MPSQAAPRSHGLRLYWWAELVEFDYDAGLAPKFIGEVGNNLRELSISTSC
jgi:hypothetical protein